MFTVTVSYIFASRRKRHTETSSASGFTLIELLVVIAIIAILAALLIVQFNTIRSKGRDTKRISDVNSMQIAVETYYDDQGSFPSALSDLEPNYLKRVPTDPSVGSGHPDYSYCSYSGGYQIAAELENQNLNALDNDDNLNPGGSCQNGDVTACTDADWDCVFDLGQ